ncbi:MAG: 4-(cytidine 5'-diphospho)-2-C-methyl-D-erythritol kinase [Dehalococcoidia bacterium]|nr:4-(cytidine 5'-diphospho)-2-C-methyl-D-erythritol kinase [Dehalococcoidia bacterium]
MLALAHAKINLSLEVLGRRPDGYHEVVTVLHTIGLADRLTFDPSDSLVLHCDAPGLSNEQNLVWQAALLLLRETTASSKGVSITLEKRVPEAAGLGGGSTDAAATLMVLNKMWGLKLSAAAQRKLAAKLGSDVPFFIKGGCAIGTGRGEVVTSVPHAPPWWAVVLRPNVSLPDKTARLYGMLTDADFTDGSATRALASRLRRGIATIADVAAARNAFERVASRAFPGLTKGRRALLKAGAPFARLTGTGPALFTLVERREEGDAILGQLKAGGYEAHVARLLGPGEDDSGAGGSRS